jgi:hypothetical protein
MFASRQTRAIIALTHKEATVAFRLTSLDPPANRGTPDPLYTRRLTDKILIAFQHACDQGDIKVAGALLDVLEFMSARRPNLPTGGERRAKETLVAAHERLWQLRHPEVEAF